MKRIKKLRFIKVILFVSIAVSLLVGATKVLERKTIEGSWNYTAKMNEFYSMPKDSIDIVGLGSSHMYSTINPLEIWEQNNLTSFLVATQRQPLNASYYYLKEVFNYQSPKVVLVEGYMAFEDNAYTDEAVAYDAIDPLRLSINKVNLINEIVPRDQRKNYYFNILKYHSRWRDVETKDFSPAYWNKEDYYKGHVFLDVNQDISIKEQEYSGIAAQPIPDVPLQSLEKIHQLTNDNQAEMVLLVAPYIHHDKELSGVIKSEIEWAERKGIRVVDINTLYDELKIDGSNDFYDASHLNSAGAKKVSSYLGNLLEENYSLDLNPNVMIEEWDLDYEKYYERFSELEISKN